MEIKRKSLTRHNRVKKISSEPDAIIKRATSGSRAIGSRPLFYIVSDHCEILRVIRHNRYLDLGNGRTSLGTTDLVDEFSENLHFVQ